MQFQVHVLAVEYPGYGICPGGPCDERRATESAMAGLRFLREVLRWPLDSIFIFGRSIGCGPAVALATQYEVGGLILVSPMTSLRDLCKDLAGALAMVVEERFPNRERVPLIASPMLIIHGLKDEVVPCRHARELFAVCRSRKLFVCPPDMTHNTDLFSNVAFLVLPMLQFFALPDYCFEELAVPAWAYSPTSFIEETYSESAATSATRVVEETSDAPSAPSVLGWLASFLGQQEVAPHERSLVREDCAAVVATTAAAEGAGMAQATLQRHLHLSQPLPQHRGLAAVGPEAPCGRPCAVPLAASAAVFVRAPPSPAASNDAVPGLGGAGGGAAAGEREESSPAPPPSSMPAAGLQGGLQAGEEIVCRPRSSKVSMRVERGFQAGPGFLRLPQTQERSASRSLLQQVPGTCASLRVRADGAVSPTAVGDDGNLGGEDDEAQHFPPSTDPLSVLTLEDCIEIATNAERALSGFGGGGGCLPPPAAAAEPL